MVYRAIIRLAVATIALAPFGLIAMPGAADAAASAAKVLKGTFRFTAGSCVGASPSGTYFRMIYPGGTITAGKFFNNPDSTCTDQSYTLVTPGASGGLINGKYQPDPIPAFSSTGGALANTIIKPQVFTAIDFSVSTNPTDPQTGLHVPPPLIKLKGGRLSGQVESWNADWNNLHFNQGSPKPDGSTPGLTQPASGTYNTKTRAFVLTWASQVVGGPFNGFTGYWHLQGTFKPAK